MRGKKSSENQFESREIYTAKCSNLDNSVLVIQQLGQTILFIHFRAVVSSELSHPPDKIHTVISPLE